MLIGVNTTTWIIFGIISFIIFFGLIFGDSVLGSILLPTMTYVFNLLKTIFLRVLSKSKKVKK